MAERGIESEEDWKDYVATMERDGEIVSDLSEMLNVNTLQIKDCVADLLRQDGDRKVAGMLESKAQESLSYNHARQDNRPLQESLYLTGPTFAESWRRRSAEEAAPKQECPGTDVNLQLVNYLRAMTCADPGIFRGAKNESFTQFVRKFKRKYQGVITCEATLVDILADDHLAGRAKNVFLSLPGRVKEQGLDAVVAEMTKLLACDSTASRLRALTELKHLRMRPNKDVAEFCVVLEDLSRQANPQGALEERSLELAQILLDNLSSWPEHFQLVGALHNVEPSRAYEEVKRLALSIEQSKLILAKRREYSLPSWKTRAVQYNCNREPGFGDKEAHYRGSVRETSGASGSPKSGPQQSNSRSSTDSRKCYACSKYGHVARDCPGRVAKVNQIAPKEKELSRDGRSLSSIINEARCMGMKISGKGSEESDLIGERLTISLKVLGEQCQALVDTGSMISIVPVELLAKAQDKGVDLDSLSMIPKAKLKPVYDASDRRMDFLAAVYLEVELKDGCTQEVAFHISPRKECEVIVGMNALSKLGIKMIIGKDPREENGKGDRLERENKVMVAERRYIPPRETALVNVVCGGERDAVTERVIWSCKQGVEAGLYSIKDQKTVLPVFNKSDQPMVLKMGEEVGYWNTDKWHEKWEDFNQLMSSEKGNKMTQPERRRLLEELITKNMETSSIDNDVRKLLNGYEEVFAVSDEELCQTNLVHMSIDTGDSPPIRMKARPVPLGVRPKLRELLLDLVRRKVIEPSKSD
ncbi:hypothetical protein V3C99_003128 [Haemonchus contortus]